MRPQQIIIVFFKSILLQRIYTNPFCSISHVYSILLQLEELTVIYDTTQHGQGRYVIHPMLRGVTFHGGRQPRATVRPQGAVRPELQFPCPISSFLGQPMAEVLKNLLVQVSSISYRCRFDPRIACLENTDKKIVGDWWTKVGGIPRPELLTGAKNSQMGCPISFQLPMGFQNLIEILIKFTL